MIYLKKFQTEEDVRVFNSPNVVLIEDTEEVRYNVEPLSGVKIQHINGSLYSKEEWTAGGFSNDDANGVAVLAPEAQFVIAKESFSDAVWAYPSNVLIKGIVTTTSSSTAGNDYKGFENTQRIVNASTSGAAVTCFNYIFPNGNRGYLPSGGEVSTAMLKRSEINAAMSVIGATEIPRSFFSSTQYDTTNAWYYDSYYNYSLTKYPKSSSRGFRPFTTL